MLLNKIYIISWLGKHAERRLGFHQRQLTWAATQKLTPIVLAQDYKAEQYQPNVEYINSPQKIPGTARNILIKKFYESDDDFAVFADDDTKLYETENHGDSSNFMELIRQSDINSFANIDIIAAINPGQTPFSQVVKREIYQNNLVFNRAYKFNGCLFLLKNLRKYNKPEMYFDEERFEAEDGSLITGEEYDFCISGLKQNLGVYRTFNAICHEMGQSYSTWVNDDSERNLHPMFNIINEKHGEAIFKIPAEKYIKFRYIGYATSPEGKTDMKFTTSEDKIGKIRGLEKSNFTNIKFYSIPEEHNESIMTVLDYARTLNDKTIDTLLEGNKTYSKRAKARVRFDWTKVPAIQNTILVNKGNDLKSTWFDYK